MPCGFVSLDASYLVWRGVGCVARVIVFVFGLLEVLTVSEFLDSRVLWRFVLRCVLCFLVCRITWCTIPYKTS